MRLNRYMSETYVHRKEQRQLWEENYWITCKSENLIPFRDSLLNEIIEIKQICKYILLYYKLAA